MRRRAVRKQWRRSRRASGGNERRGASRAAFRSARCLGRGEELQLAARVDRSELAVPSQSGYDFAGDVSAPESLVQKLGDPRTVQPRLRLSGRQIATSWNCGLKSQRVPKFRFLRARRQSSGGVDTRIPSLVSKVDPNANFKEKDEDEH
jgi:hypothetical protein